MRTCLPGGPQDGPGGHVAVLERRIAELAARAALNELVGELGLK